MDHRVRVFDADAVCSEMFLPVSSMEATKFLLLGAAIVLQHEVHSFRCESERRSGKCSPQRLVSLTRLSLSI